VVAAVAVSAEVIAVAVAQYDGAKVVFFAAEIDTDLLGLEAIVTFGGL
jgi:hypothetical protein